MAAARLGELERDPAGGALVRLRGVYPSLKTALQKVANRILSQPEMAIYASVSEIAAASQVSEATVMRLCRLLGFKGFQDFKIALARELAGPVPHRREESDAKGDPAALVHQVFGTNISALNETLEVLDPKRLHQAGQYLLGCRKLAVMAVGGSAMAVQYADLRFNAVGLPVHGFSDRHLMLIAAALLTADDVLLAISHFGDTREILEAVRAAKENHARVIAITSNAISALSRMADLVLITASRDIILPLDGLASLLCQISIIDSLFAVVLEARPDESRVNLAKIEKVFQRPA